MKRRRGGLFVQLKNIFWRRETTAGDGSAFEDKLSHQRESESSILIAFESIHFLHHLQYMYREPLQPRKDYKMAVFFSFVIYRLGRKEIICNLSLIKQVLLNISLRVFVESYSDTVNWSR